MERGTTMPRAQPARGWLLAPIAALCILAYLPTLRQPLLEDDYPNLAIARHYGDPAAWRDLSGSVYRLRATSEWLMFAAYREFGLDPAPYYAVAIALHILCAWLVYALGFWPRVGYRVAAWAAAFFAIYEGHQEAVMWFSACNELLQFLFGVAALVCWLHFLWGEKRRGAWYAAALMCLALALVSKESAPVFVLLMALPLLDLQWGATVQKRSATVRDRWLFRRPNSSLSVSSGERWPGSRVPGPIRPKSALLALAPFWLLAGAAALSVYAARGSSFRFQDGSFSLHAPFWRTWPFNLARLFWFWGWLALAGARRRALPGVAWAALGILPYVFLTYSSRIPSRQFYLASAGVALVVGFAMAELRARRAVVITVCAVVIAQNVGYLWIKKRRQFLQRAEPTQELIAYAKRIKGPVTIRCFPRAPLIAEEAVRLGAGRSDIVWDGKAPQGFCYQAEK